MKDTTTTDLVHVNYPHESGRLYDCPACEARCHCTGALADAECVYEGSHRFDRGALDRLAAEIEATDFNHPFTVHPDGSFTDAPAGVYAPSVFHDDTADIEIDGRPGVTGETWQALTGMTGQYGYHGAVMHSSEYVGSGIAHKLQRLAADAPETFVIVSVECYPDDIEPDDPIPAGWAILRHL